MLCIEECYSSRPGVSAIVGHRRPSRPPASKAPVRSLGEYSVVSPSWLTQHARDTQDCSDINRAASIDTRVCSQCTVVCVQPQRTRWSGGRIECFTTTECSRLRALDWNKWNAVVCPGRPERRTSARSASLRECETDDCAAGPRQHRSRRDRARRLRDRWYRTCLWYGAMRVLPILLVLAQPIPGTASRSSRRGSRTSR